MHLPSSAASFGDRSLSKSRSGRAYPELTSDNSPCGYRNRARLPTKDTQARALGLTQPRVTQIMVLLSLSPALKEQALVGAGLGIRAAMRAAREAEWAGQE